MIKIARKWLQSPATLIQSISSRNTLKYILILSFHLRLNLANYPLPSGFPVNILHTFCSKETPTSWTVEGLNPVEEEIFRTRPDRPCGPQSLLYNGYRVSFRGVRGIAALAWH